MDKYLNTFSEELCAHFEPEALFPVKKTGIMEWFRHPFIARKNGNKQHLTSGRIGRSTIGIFKLIVSLIILSLLAVANTSTKKDASPQPRNNAGTCITGYYSMRRKCEIMIYKIKVTAQTGYSNYISEKFKITQKSKNYHHEHETINKTA